MNTFLFIMTFVFLFAGCACGSIAHDLEFDDRRISNIFMGICMISSLLAVIIGAYLGTIFFIGLLDEIVKATQ